MYWNALKDLQDGKAIPVPSPHPKFSVEVRAAQPSSCCCTSTSRLCYFGITG